MNSLVIILGVAFITFATCLAIAWSFIADNRRRSMSNKSQRHLIPSMAGIVRRLQERKAEKKSA